MSKLDRGQGLSSCQAWELRITERRAMIVCMDLRRFSLVNNDLSCHPTRMDTNGSSIMAAHLRILPLLMHQMRTIHNSHLSIQAINSTHHHLSGGTLANMDFLLLMHIYLHHHSITPADHHQSSFLLLTPCRTP